MAFDKNKFAKLDNSLGASNSGFNSFFNYLDYSTDTYAAVTASGYFDSVSKFFKKGDVIYIQATDDRNFVAVSSEAGVIPVTVAPILDASVIPDNSISTAKIQDGAVTAAKLDSATISHIVKYASTFVTVGGTTTETINVSGILETDIVLTQLETIGAVPRIIERAYVISNNIKVQFSGDPSNDHVITYQVLRAVS